MPQPHLLLKLLRLFWASAFCSLVVASSLFAQRQAYPIALGAYGGIALGIGSAALFDGYRQITGLRSNDFDVPLVAGASVLIDFDGVRIGARGEYLRAQSIERGSPPAAPQRTLEERMQLEMSPLLLSAEWEPWREQFRTYLSAGIGAAFARFQWYETAFSDGRLERSRPVIDERQAVPAVRIGAGTYLFFDADRFAAFRGGLVLELHYTYSPLRLAVFRNYVNGSTATSQQWNNDIIVGGSALVLTVGVRFQIGRHR